MYKKKQEKHTSLEIIDPSQAAEIVMLEWLIDQAKTFYAKPENLKDFEKWQLERAQKPSM